MKLSLTKLEAEMLLDAANRMEAEDVWQEGDGYSLAQSEALNTAASKIAIALADAAQKRNSP